MEKEGESSVQLRHPERVVSFPKKTVNFSFLDKGSSAVKAGCSVLMEVVLNITSVYLS